MKNFIDNVLTKRKKYVILKQTKTIRRKKKWQNENLI